MGGQPLAAATGGARPERGVGGRVGANLAALQVLARLRQEDRRPSELEREQLTRWRSWGAEPGIFEEDSPRAEALRGLLSAQEWNSARRTTINAHYTDPQLARAIWQGVRGLGFEGGRVLEPGCGSGLFIQEAPADLPVEITGVELDPVSAQIAAYLHPHASIRAESFASSPLAEDSFDLTIGNVPFADVSLHDTRHNRDRHSLHNHFIIKSLHLTRPGGMVAVLTSRYTMDSLSGSARAQMGELADLIGAVRLPSGAHRGFAGTDAVTDLLILRRRPVGEPARGASWLTSRADEVLSVPVNDYWRAHPQQVIGSMVVQEHGMYGREDLAVQIADRARVPALFAQGVHALVEHAEGEGLTFTGPSARGAVLDEPGLAGGPGQRLRGRISYDDQGRWHQSTGAGQEEFEVPASVAGELRALVDLRDATLRVLDLEGTSVEDTGELTRARQGLRRGYETYVRQYGPINRVSVRQSARLDREGQPVSTRTYPAAMRLLRRDPHAPVVKALEHYEEASGTATGATILHERVLAPSSYPTRAQSPADALAIVLDARGQVDLGEIARLLDMDVDQARAGLGTLVFDDPVSGRLVSAPEYLSGNVRQRLRQAEEAAQGDRRFAVNVAQLRRVIPADLEPGQITANLGAVWIPAAEVSAFLRETLGESSVQVEHLGAANWRVRGGLRQAPAATSTWGTERMCAHEIVERVMRQQRVVVHDTVERPDGGQTSVVNVVATEAAAAKAGALQEAFGRWVWADPQRAQRLARRYNDTFNAIVLRSYDAEGERLSLPGLAVGFEPHPHQRAAVARMIGEPSVGLFHAVGAGKTAEMVMGTTELKRLGLITKACVVVPNHMLEQVAREWLQLYPAASILTAASDDLRGAGRRDFIAKAATGSWDAVLLTQGAFASIPVSQEAQRSYLEREVASVREQLEKARAAGLSSMSLKSLEKAVIRQEQRVERLLDRRRDLGVSWEQTGIDYLVVDELHLYKNLTVVSNIQDVAREGSQRATDLDMKLHLLREKAGPHGRVMTGATATPIANTMAEAWVMQRYLRPDLLADAGLSDFDSWAATFGRTVSKLEMRPAGDGFRVRDRFAAFDNLPELLQMWHVPADVKTARDLALPVPAITPGPDGRRAPEIVAVAMSRAQREFMTSLAQRSQLVQARAVAPSVDNMLKISSDGRTAGLDLRLMGARQADPGLGGLSDEPTKIAVAAARIARMWQEHRQDRYPGSERPGALQIVFCDLGTPSEHWNVYDGLRAELAERGMDPRRVRFVHEAGNDEQKARLFAAARGGEIDVLIGSTSRMGVGTNIQARAVALHHLDCPWRPADVEQREGRILRQGNHNQEVSILRYVTEGSFDAYMWQGIARKAAFIDQVMHGRVEQRSAEDLDAHGEQFDYATITAVASGNPLLLERAEAQAEVDKLHRLALAHERAQSHLHATISGLGRQIDSAQAALSALEVAAAKVRSTRGEAFAAIVDGARFGERPAAADAIRRHVHAASQRLGAGQASIVTPGLVRLGGQRFDLALERTTMGTRFTLALAEAPEVARVRGGLDLCEGNGIITRLENIAASLPGETSRYRDMITRLRGDLEEARRGLGEPFPRADELSSALERLHDIETCLAEAASPPEPPASGLPHEGVPDGVRASFPSVAPSGSRSGVHPGARVGPRAEHARGPVRVEPGLDR